MAENLVFFISRAGADKRWAQWIDDILSEAGHRTYHQDDPEDGVLIGESIPDWISNKLEDSDVFISVFSPDYFKSKWCMREFKAALALQMDHPKRRLQNVIPVVVAECELPAHIADLKYVDLCVVKDDAAGLEHLRTELAKLYLDHPKKRPSGSMLHAAVPEDSDRARALARIRTRAVSRYFDDENNLYHGVRIHLHLSVTPEANVLDEGPAREKPLSQNLSVSNVYDKMDQMLLIQGDQGSGKSFLLRELLDEFLNRAGGSQSHPIPAVFMLTTWAKKRRPLDEWLAEELEWLYGVPSDVAKAWTAGNQILPLLDGLDEVKTEYRASCIRAINEFRSRPRQPPPVVCCRTAEYDELPSSARLSGLGGVVAVCPLAQPQVSSYLDQLGSIGTNIRGVLAHDSSLSELLDTPLALSVVVRAYGDDPGLLPPKDGTLEQRRQRLWTTYVKRMLERKPLASGQNSSTTIRPYTSDQTLHWLSWLAEKMVEREITVFYIERLQPDWLSMRSGWFVPGVGLLSGLGVGTLVGILCGLIYGPSAGLSYGALAGFGGMLVGPTIDKSGLGEMARHRREEIVCSQGWTWDTHRAMQQGGARRKRRVLLALTLGVLAGVIQGANADRESATYYGLFIGLAFFSVFFVIGFLFIGIFDLIQGGFRYDQIDLDDKPNRGIRKPNQGIRESLKNAFLASGAYALGGGLVSGLVAGLLFWYIGVLDDITKVGPAVCLGFGLIGWFLHGGSAVVKHCALRLLLAWNRDAPLHYATFLDFACERILLSKDGNRFQFIHELLRDHFAGRRHEGT
jgi:hypothetical protein